MKWIYLTIAIAFETIATTALKSSEGFTKLWPSLVTVGSYAVSFYLLSLALRYIPIGIAYALWSAVGIVLIASIGYYRFGQKLDLAALVGIGLILAGVVVINTLSKSVSH